MPWVYIVLDVVMILCFTVEDWEKIGYEIRISLIDDHTDTEYTFVCIGRKSPMMIVIL